MIFLKVRGDIMRFKNKTALITGGGTGIGAAVARRIRLEGGSVALVGRRPELALGLTIALQLSQHVVGKLRLRNRAGGGLSAEL
ncbi:hypothetical protein CHY08_23560 (plasmid) [Rhizobium leguminosarum bv. viciae]|nr:hypothetical protein CHY08_23560 [Rhizobium leguminosarum bv. viciae]